MDVSIHKAKAEFTKLIAAAERGEKIVITRHGRAVVEFKPVGRVGGFDFSLDDPLRDECGLPETPQPVSDTVDDHALSREVLGVEEGPENGAA
jgi:antitoxin (DNA-binding transcriptional repressor) of toxin-antitoxin stability system